MHGSFSRLIIICFILVGCVTAQNRKVDVPVKGMPAENIPDLKKKAAQLVKVLARTKKWSISGHRLTFTQVKREKIKEGSTLIATGVGAWSIQSAQGWETWYFEVDFVARLYESGMMRYFTAYRLENEEGKKLETHGYWPGGLTKKCLRVGKMGVHIERLFKKHGPTTSKNFLADPKSVLSATKAKVAVRKAKERRRKASRLKSDSQKEEGS